MNWNYVVLSLAFAFFVMCPRMAGMCAVISRTSGVNPYLIAVLGGIMAAPLISPYGVFNDKVWCWHRHSCGGYNRYPTCHSDWDF